MSSHFHFMILAGGGGTRLWPASRRKRPKQFLPLLPGGQTLLSATVDRLAALAPPERLWVVTASDQIDEVLRCAPSLRRENLVVEPEARNTAPCVGLAAVEVARRDPEAVMAVIPSDQYVAQKDRYRQALGLALNAAQTGGVVTIGITPTAPETGFGYVERGAERSKGVFAVERFVEKPDRKTAESYLTSGCYLWNSGMFFFRAATIRQAIAHHMPELEAILDEITLRPERAAALYPKAPKISIDYGVMERLPKGEVSVVPGDFGWSDVGAFSALSGVRETDAKGNVAIGETITLDASDNILYSEGERIVCAVGVSDLVIVATGDAVLVLPKERAQEVREIVSALEKSKRESYL